MNFLGKLTLWPISMPFWCFWNEATKKTWRVQEYEIGWMLEIAFKMCKWHEKTTHIFNVRNCGRAKNLAQAFHWVSLTARGKWPSMAIRSCVAPFKVQLKYTQLATSFRIQLTQQFAWISKISPVNFSNLQLFQVNQVISKWHRWCFHSCPHSWIQSLGRAIAHTSIARESWGSGNPKVSTSFLLVNMGSYIPPERVDGDRHAHVYIGLSWPITKTPNVGVAPSTFSTVYLVNLLYRDPTSKQQCDTWSLYQMDSQTRQPPPQQRYKTQNLQFV